MSVSCDYAQDQLEEEEEINNVKENIKNLEANLKGLEDDFFDPNDVYSKLIVLEDISKRNNLHIDGIEKAPNETWVDCETKIQESILKTRIKIILKLIVVIDYRERKIRIVRPRTIICLITKFKVKQ